MPNKNVISFEAQLSLLKQYRNEETHFYINEDDYLNEKDFVILHDFMLSFYEILKDIGIFNYWGRPSITSHKILGHFDCKKLDNTNFTYRDALKNSKNARRIADRFDNYQTSLKESPYSLAFQYMQIEPIYMTIEQVYGYIKSMFFYKLIEFERNEVEGKEWYFLNNKFDK